MKSGWGALPIVPTLAPGLYAPTDPRDIRGLPGTTSFQTSDIGSEGLWREPVLSRRYGFDPLQRLSPCTVAPA